MTKKYIITVESSQGDEVICRPRGGPIISREEARDFVFRHTKDFPQAKYRIYRLEQVAESAMEIRL